MAIEKGASEGVVLALLTAYPEAAKKDLEEQSERKVRVLAMCTWEESVGGWVGEWCGRES